MHLSIETLRAFEGLDDLLARDGWRVERPRSNRLLAWHLEAQDEPSVRSRLHKLELLTSSSLRIHIEPGDTLRERHALGSRRVSPKSI
jgi:hypothetical protein